MRSSRFIGIVGLLFLVACGDKAGEAKPEAAGSAAQPASATPATAATDAPSAEPTAAATAESSADPSAAAAATAAPSAGSVATTAGTAATTAEAVASATASAAAVPDAPDVQGEQKKGATFSAYLAAKPKYEKGKPGTVTAVVVAQGGYKINQEYPFKFKVGAAPAGLSFPETVVRNVNRTKSQASISIPFSADAAGTHTVTGECSLSVCTDANCVIEKVPLSVAVKVE